MRHLRSSMATFRFDFASKKETTIPSDALDEPTVGSHQHEATELPFVAVSPEVFDGEVDVVTLTESLRLQKGTLSASITAKAMQRNDLKSSDLIPGEYEGGFKLWEGAMDLCHFLVAQAQHPSPHGIARGMSVLEMGCGHGLPGIVCLQFGLCVDFQDFNIEVLKHLTMFNVNLALKDFDIPAEAVRFFGGEFKSVAALCGHQGRLYDRIIASEILYRCETYASILDSIAEVLRPQGVVFIASKIYYFGVGGSLQSFIDLVRLDDRFVAEIVWRNEDISNGRRAILKLTFKTRVDAV